MRYIVICLALVSAATLVSAEDWPQFRGPGGEGHAAAQGTPLSWSETTNVSWKTPIAGLGWSSPVIQGKQIWLTTAVDEGRSLRAVSLDQETGKIVHDVEVFAVAEPAGIHSKNSHASPTPILEGDRVYVHYGAHGTACLTTSGELVWKTTDLHYDHRHGPAGSPTLFEDLLIISCDGTDVQFVVALDKQTGKIRWKKHRQGPMAYSTPLVIKANGVHQLISTGGDQVVSYDPRTGDEIWKFRYKGYSNVPRPVFGQGLVFICSGYDSASLYAIRPDGKGDVTDTHLAWSLSRGIPLNPSPLLVDDLLFIVNDGGIATCFDAESGADYWQERMDGNYSASPLLADAKLYFLNEEGLTTVIEPTKEFKVLAKNQLEGRTLASLAPLDGALLLRTDTHLYRIEESAAGK